MKLIISVLIIAIIGAGIYFLTSEEPLPIELKENLIVSQAGSTDINNASATASFRAKIFGTAKNISESTLKDIVIEYNIAGNSVKGHISLLEPGKELYFTSSETITGNNNPSFKLNGVTYSIKE